MTPPPKTPRICSTPGCPTETHGRRCPEHERAQQAQWKRDPRYNTTRWKTLRRSQLRKQPWCQAPTCNNPANEADHIIRPRDGGNFYDRNNLQSLCKGCHSRKTAGETWHTPRTN